MRGTTLRVWVVEDRCAAAGGALESQLKQLAERSAGEIVLLGARPAGPDYPALLQSWAPEVLVLDEPAWPEEPWTEEVLKLGAGVVIVTKLERANRFRALAGVQPFVFLPPAPSLEALQLALVGASASRARQLYWRSEVERLQQRLSDRILIERAKGILVQRLQIPEEEAYNRLRVLSRRQRRPMRDIAQSLLEAQLLLTPQGDGTANPLTGDLLNGTDELSPQL